MRCQRIPIRNPLPIALSLRVAFSLIVCSLLMHTGCDRTKTGSITTESIAVKDPARKTHAMEEHFPKHWPFTIEQASQRLSAIARDPQAPSPVEGLSPREEFHDVMKWLPLLAADSDLDRKAFELIDRGSIEWQSALQAARADEALFRERLIHPDTIAFLQSLDAICRAERARLDQLQQP